MLLGSLSLLAASFAPASGNLEIHADNPHIQFDGRFKQLEDGSKEFDAPGFRISVGVNDVEDVSIVLTSNGVDQPHRFWVYVDGEKTDEYIDTTGTPVGVANQYSVVAGLDGRRHEVSIVKVTEADYNRADPVYNTLTFSGLLLDGGETVSGNWSWVSPRAGSAQRPGGKSRKIQFIGDSITAGYCNMCNEVSDTAGAYAQESFAASWPFLVADRFAAAYQAAAWSGFGMYRNCCGGEVEMPEIFSRTLASLDAPDWDYSSWVPDVVVVNLGTNDRLNGTDPGEAEVAYQQTYIDFVRNISRWYGGGPVLFLACGPMSEEYCPYVFNVISELENEVPVHFLDHRNVLNSTNQCCNHPDHNADQTMADITIETLSATMGWDYH